MMKRPLESHVSLNYDDRPDGVVVKYLVYHFTGGSLEESLEWLIHENPLGAKVSAHYLISESGDVYNLVPEAKRAWHAGVSAWEEDENLNALSIGIELVNCGEAYPAAQMDALVELSKDIVARHGILPWYVLGHSDIAPGRKDDPGEHFDWQSLARHGVGLYPEVVHGFESSVLDVQEKLKAYGYRIDVTGEVDAQTQDVLMAFQAHFGRGELGLISAKLDCLLAEKSMLRHDIRTMVIG